MTTGFVVPSEHGSEQEWIEFAHTFGGYGSFANGPDSFWSESNRVSTAWDQDGELPTDLDLLRACLFYEVRGHRHRGDVTPFNELVFVRALVSRIREVSGGTVS
ncbi:hypothetical protein GCM10011591_00420 [Nocardia camponoti]|uniref:Uncharacterized protein n=1 Tax=Nocardia camponoti TaxID=1616106 RepID=A0A917Q6Q3_9NOCA|nr:hypothetical protein GCM10011591_00420 [Nocardia camponoti]